MSWTASTGGTVDRYELWRSANNAAYSQVGSPTGTSFSDNTLSAGRVDQQTQADGGVWLFSYTTNNVVTETRMTDPRNNTTTYRFNGRGYLLSQTDPFGQTTMFTRDSATKEVLSTTDALGQVTSFEYAAANEQTQFAGTAFTYDANGNLTNDGTDTYTWDARNRLTGISDGVTASFSYDAFGRRISKTVSGTTTQYLYDANDVIQEIQGGAASVKARRRRLKRYGILYLSSSYTR